ncbi:MAG: molybdopterin-dependent oxidoreductase, partial [Dehalococcoidia bacterium]|nr:molybdopterin-dependent oxidoreductase [Dehalococcoidia bacterium]
MQRAAAGDLDVLYVAGSDPATAVTDRRAWEAARRGVGFLVVHEAFRSATAEAADVVLPALVLPEKDGTVTNLEGRTLPL